MKRFIVVGFLIPLFFITACQHTSRPKPINQQSNSAKKSGIEVYGLIDTGYSYEKTKITQ